MVSLLPPAEGEAGFPESLQPMPAKQSASESPAVQKTLRTLDDLEIIDIGYMPFTTRLRVLVRLTSLLQTRRLQI